MKLKSQKGFTGIDVTIAVLIVTIFAGMITALYGNYAKTSKDIERKAQAVDYAINAIESAKSRSAEFFNEENAKREEIIEYDNGDINKGFSTTTRISDYATLGYREDAELGYVKRVKVTVSYKLSKETKTVELTTFISKEN